MTEILTTGVAPISPIYKSSLGYREFTITMNKQTQKEQRLQRAIERGIIPPHLCPESVEALQGQRHSSRRPERRSVAPSTLSTTEALRQPNGSASA